MLLGKVTFTRTAATKTEDPDNGGALDPAVYFGITLNYAHGTGLATDDFKNFVATDSTVLDGPTNVSFDHPSFTGVPVKIAERGDANARWDFISRDLFFY